MSGKETCLEEDMEQVRKYIELANNSSIRGTINISPYDMCIYRLVRQSIEEVRKTSVGVALEELGVDKESVAYNMIQSIFSMDAVALIYETEKSIFYLLISDECYDKIIKYTDLPSTMANLNLLKLFMLQSKGAKRVMTLRNLKFNYNRFIFEFKIQK